MATIHLEHEELKALVTAIHNCMILNDAFYSAYGVQVQQREIIDKVWSKLFTILYSEGVKDD